MEMSKNVERNELEQMTRWARYQGIVIHDRIWRSEQYINMWTGAYRTHSTNTLPGNNMEYLW